MRWLADQMLAWHLVKQPLKWKDWTEEMHRELPRAQLELSKELGGEKRKAWGIRPGSIEPEQISAKLFRSSAVIVVIDPGGHLRPLHPRDQQVFQKFKDEYKVPEWRDIEFDPVDETKQESPEPPLNSVANDAERMASAPVPAADAEDQDGAAAAAAAGTKPRKRLGTTGRPPEKRAAAAERMRADLRKQRLTPDALRNMKQEALAKRYDCGREAACRARDDVLSEMSEIEFPTNTDTK
jgi:hypothetical protein